jgi:hypothetical protein
LLSVARNIAIAPPNIILGRPPAAEGISASEIVGIDHASVIERPFVVAPAALAVIRWAKVAACLANTLQTKVRERRRGVCACRGIDLVILHRRERVRGEERLVTELVHSRLFDPLTLHRWLADWSRLLETWPGSAHAARFVLVAWLERGQGRR